MRLPVFSRVLVSLVYDPSTKSANCSRSQSYQQDKCPCRFNLQSLVNSCDDFEHKPTSARCLYHNYSTLREAYNRPLLPVLVLLRLSSMHSQEWLCYWTHSAASLAAEVSEEQARCKVPRGAS